MSAPDLTVITSLNGSVQARFEACAASVRTYVPGAGKTVTSEDKLKAYGLFKQATVGDNTTDRPGMLSFEGRAKWDAWTAVKGLSKEAAMEQYITEITRQQAFYA